MRSGTERIRRLAFTALLGAFLFGLRSDLFAHDSPMDTFCYDWDYGPHDCNDCEFNEANDPDFLATGSCDFSAIEDEGERSDTALAYFNEAGEACSSTCDWDYAEYLAQWYGSNGNPWDPCYTAWQNPWNWITWDQLSGSAGPVTEWACECQKVFWGECY